MRMKSLLLLGLLCMGDAHAQMNNSQYHQQQQRIQNQNHAAEQNRLGYMTQQQQMQQQLPLPPPQPTGWWEKTWGAIATDGTKGSLGAALGASSEAEAKQVAMDDCRTNGGINCTLDLAYHNQCSALVIGQEGLSVSSAGSIEEAEQIGMEPCGKSEGRGCRVYYSACTEPVFHRY